MPTKLLPIPDLVNKIYGIVNEHGFMRSINIEVNEEINLRMSSLLSITDCFDLSSFDISIQINIELKTYLA